MRSSDGDEQFPTVTVLLPPSDELPPGLDTIRDDADLRIARGPDQLASLIGDTVVVCNWEFRTNHLAAVWDEARRLEWVHTASAGVDAVMFPGLARSDVIVTNTQGVLDDTIAEWVLGVMLLFTKDLHTTLELQRKRLWKHRESERLAGRTAVVVGAGSIGRAVGRLCAAVGMEVKGVARRRRDDPVFGSVAGIDELSGLLPEADFLVLSTPLTAETRGLVGADELAALPGHARVINVGRGPVIDEGALIDALRSGRVAGAALDVFDEEPLPAEHPYWDMSQVVVSPHQSGDFEGWEEAFSGVFVDNYRRWRKGAPMENVVDKDSLATEAESS